MSKLAIHQIHINEARDYALRLSNAASSMMPDPWTKDFAEILTRDLLSFGFHARAAIEMDGLGVGDFETSIDEYTVKFQTPPEGQRETELVFALNRILHARDFGFGWSQSTQRILFEKNKNLIPTYVCISTDKHPKSVISLFGISYVFLNEAINKITKKVNGK